MGLLSVNGLVYATVLASPAHAATDAVQLEDSGELLERRVLDGNLVRNSPQKRLGPERRRIEVRREHGEHVERHLELLAGVQREVVDAALERHDPAVQELFWPH